ncbi:MAG: hypothetical protein HY873_07175 [Chloroflexi bacterium]|nr:hypothetical protein [Chloroflexota bacterium]
MKMKLAAVVAGIAAISAAALVGADAMGVFAGGGGGSTKAEVRLDVVDTANNALASGKAKSEQRPDRTRFSIEAEDVQTEPGAYQVRITRNGSPVADSAGITLNVDTLGFGETELNTQDGDTVPTVLSGDLVEVLDPTGTTVILSGVLAPKQ